MTFSDWIALGTLILAVLGGAIGVAGAFWLARTEGRVTRALLDAGLKNVANKFDDFARTNERLFELHERRMETLETRLHGIEQSVLAKRPNGTGAVL